MTTDYTYDTLNRLHTETQKNSSGTTLYSVTYTLNPDGTRATATEQQLQSDNSTTASIITEWIYDALDRLTNVNVSSTLTGQSYSDIYTYD